MIIVFKQCDFLGFGRGRAVIKLDDNTVIKVPFNDCGIAQNLSEYNRFNNEDNEYLAKVINYDLSNNFLYMEYVEDKSKFFQQYVKDKIYCEKYDEDNTIQLDCNAQCKKCNFNTIKKHLPKNFNEILSHCPVGDRPQLGLDKDGKYKYYDYADIDLTQNTNVKFYDSDIDLFVQYMNEENKNVSLGEYLINNRGELGTNNKKIGIGITRRLYCRYVNKHNN